MVNKMANAELITFPHGQFLKGTLATWWYDHSYPFMEVCWN